MYIISARIKTAYYLKDINNNLNLCVSHQNFYQLIVNEEEVHCKSFS